MHCVFIATPAPTDFPLLPIAVYPAADEREIRTWSCNRAAAHTRQRTPLWGGQNFNLDLRAFALEQRVETIVPRLNRSTTAYAFHCPERALPFMAIWYVAGIAVTTAVDAVLGPRLLSEIA